MANISKSLFIRLTMHLSRSHQMFSHKTTISYFGFLDLYRRKIIWKIFAGQYDAPLHRSTPYSGLLDKKIVFCFYWFWK